MLLLISYGNYNIIINYRVQFETMIYALIAFIIISYKFHFISDHLDKLLVKYEMFFSAFNLQLMCSRNCVLKVYVW